MDISSILGYEQSSHNPARSTHPATFHDAQKYTMDHGVTLPELDAIGGKIMPLDRLFQEFGNGRDNHNRLAIVLPHFDMANKDIGWFTCRVIGEKSKGFDVGQLVQNSLPTWCPPKQPIHAWLHPNRDWLHPPDGGFEIDIHESVFKAVVGGRCCDTYPIGLNGVACGAPGHVLVKELDELLKEDVVKHVRIIFDDNTVTNHGVATALEELSALIQMRGIDVYMHHVPDGMDDLNAMWESKGEQFVIDWLAEEGTLGKLEGLAGAKVQISRECVLVFENSHIAHIESGIMMNRSSFVGVNYADRTATVYDKDGKGKLVKVPELWLADSKRRQVQRAVFDPTVPLIVENKTINLYRPDWIKGVDGDVAILLNFMRRQINNDEVYEELLNVLAWPLQHPGNPPALYPVLVSTKHGRTGKSLLLEYLYMPMFGKWGDKVTPSDFMQDKPFWTKSLFVLIEELFDGKDGMKAINRVKDYVTAEMARFEDKYIPSMLVKKCFMFGFTSNNIDFLKLDSFDRRAFVVGFGQDHTYADYAEMSAAADAVAQWAMHEQGSAKFYTWLMKRDLSGWDHRRDAMATEMRDVVIEATQDKYQDFIDELAGDGWAELWPKRYATPTELASVFTRANDSQFERGLESALKSKMLGAGYRQVQVNCGNVTGNKRWYDLSGANEFAPALIKSCRGDKPSKM